MCDQLKIKYVFQLLYKAQSEGTYLRQGFIILQTVYLVIENIYGVLFSIWILIYIRIRQ